MFNKEMNIKEFRKRLSDEIEPAEKAYEQAGHEYASVLRKFIIENITGKRSFKRNYQLALDHLCFTNPEEECYIDEIRVLNAIIYDHDFYLEELAESSE